MEEDWGHREKKNIFTSSHVFLRIRTFLKNLILTPELELSQKTDFSQSSVFVLFLQNSNIDLRILTLVKNLTLISYNSEFKFSVWSFLTILTLISES